MRIKVITFLTSITVIAALFFTFNGIAFAGWHDWSQAQRNQAIINRANNDDGAYVGVSCKEWVRDVVYDASGGAVTIPSTVDPPGWYWNSHPYVTGYSSMIEYAQPGEIVQMQLSSGGPHTAIILSISSSGVTFIESNWCSPATCYTVNIRYVTFTTFYNQVSNYTIYYIK